MTLPPTFGSFPKIHPNSGTQTSPLTKTDEFSERRLSLGMTIMTISVADDNGNDNDKDEAEKENDNDKVFMCPSFADISSFSKRKFHSFSTTNRYILPIFWPFLASETGPRKMNVESSLRHIKRELRII